MLAATPPQSNAHSLVSRPATRLCVSVVPCASENVRRTTSAPSGIRIEQASRLTIENEAPLTGAGRLRVAELRGSSLQPDPSQRCESCLIHETPPLSVIISF